MMNDFSQILVVTKNEVIKSVRGRKFMISLAMVGIVFLLITGLQFMLGSWDSLTNMGALADTYLNTLPIIIALVVALLSSIALVSEFEERTALILFTRPIRRTTILIGKILSCVLIEAMILLVYYILVSCVGIAKVDDMSIDILTSYGIAVLYAFSASGIAFVISAFLKKGSVCTIISLLIILVIMPIISAMVASDGGENWYMIDQAGNTVYTSIPGYVERYNETTREFAQVVEDATKILSGFTDQSLQEAVTSMNNFIGSPGFQMLEPETQQALITMSGYLSQTPTENLSGMIMVLKILASSSLIAPMESPDLFKECMVLLAWGFTGYFIAWIKFIRREF